MTPYSRFALAGPNVICNQKCFMIAGKNLEFLCAILNSKLVTWFVRRTAVTTGMGLPQWDKFTVERVPVIQTDRSTEDKLRKIVKSTLIAIEHADEQEGSRIQQWLDRHIFDIYGLTANEREAISCALNSP